MSSSLGFPRRVVIGAIAGLTAAGLLLSGYGAASPPSIAASSPSTNEKVTLTLSLQVDNVPKNDPVTWGIVQAFMKKYPNITIKVSGQPVAQHLQNMIIAAQTNTLPDIFWEYNADALALSKAGKILDLAPMVRAAGINNIPSSMLATFNSGKAQYGVPQGSLITGLYFNKDILKKSNLAVPVTLNDLLKVCKTVSATGITPISDGANQSSFSVWAFLGMLSRFGYQDMYKKILAKTASYDNPTFLKFYQAIDQMRKANCFASNVSTQTYQQAVAAFMSGKAAMLDSGIWTSQTIDQSNLRGKVGFWAGPSFSNGVGNQKLVIDVPGAPFVVSSAATKGSAKYDAIQKFFAYYYSDAGQQILVEHGEGPVTTLKAKVDQKTQPTFAAVLAAVSAPGWTSPAAQPDLVVPTSVANAMYDSIYGVIEGAVTPTDATKLVQKAFDAIAKQ